MSLGKYNFNASWKWPQSFYSNTFSVIVFPIMVSHFSDKCPLPAAVVVTVVLAACALAVLSPVVPAVAYYPVVVD